MKNILPIAIFLWAFSLGPAAAITVLGVKIKDTPTFFEAELTIAPTSFRRNTDLSGLPLAESSSFSVMGIHWAVYGTMVSQVQTFGESLWFDTLTFEHTRPPPSHNEALVNHIVMPPAFLSFAGLFTFGDPLVDVSFDVDEHETHWHSHKVKYSTDAVDDEGLFNSPIVIQLTALHTVPVPAPLLMLGALMTAAAAAAWRKKRGKPAPGGTIAIHPA